MITHGTRSLGISTPTRGYQKRNLKTGISYRLCPSYRPFFRHPCLEVHWEAAQARFSEPAPPPSASVAGRVAVVPIAVVGVYPAWEQALLEAREIFARVFAHLGAAESCLVEEAHFDAAQFASAPFASALRYRPPRADCPKVAHFSSIHENHFPGRSHLSPDPGPVNHRQRLVLDDHSFPVCSRCEQCPPDRQWRRAFSALLQHSEAQLAGAVCGLCPVLRTWHLPLQHRYPYACRVPARSRREQRSPARQLGAYPAHRQHWEPHLAVALCGSCLLLRKWRPAFQCSYLDDCRVPAYSRCAPGSPARQLRVECPARRQRWERLSFRALCGPCPALQTRHLPVQRSRLDDYLDPACSSRENLYPARHRAWVRPARRRHWDLRLTQVVSGYSPERRRWVESTQRVDRSNDHCDPPAHSGDLSPYPA